MTMTKIHSRKPSGTYGHGPLINLFHLGRRFDTKRVELRGPAAILSISRDTCSDSIAKLSFVLVFVGLVAHDSGYPCCATRVALHVSHLISWILERFAGVAPVSRYTP